MAGLGRSLFEFLHQFAGKNAFLDGLFVFLAQYLLYLLVLGFLVFVFRLQRDWRLRLALFSETLLAVILSRGIITEILRFFYYSPRPFLLLNFTPLVS